VPIEAADHENVTGVELIEYAALIGAVGLGSTRHFAKDLARGRAVCTEKALSDQRSDLWRYTGGAQGRTATRSSGDERPLRCIIW
jgi:hypothetical protein